MKWNLVTDNDIRQLPVFEQFFAFAYTYLSAAELLCEREINRSDAVNWASGTVVLMNASHAVELFLKAVLLRADEKMDLRSIKGHDIAALAKKYEERFSAPDLAWDIPFRHIQPEQFSADEYKAYRSGIAYPSIEYRYPVTNRGMPWFIHHGFEAGTFALDLKQIKADFDRIYNGKS